MLSAYEKHLYSEDFVELRVKRKCERLDSYVKCLVCGAKLRQVHPNHLAKHNLTVEEYLQKFPYAKLISKDYSEELSERYRQNLGKERLKVCIDCNRTFITYSHNKLRCPTCQRKYRLNTLRNRERMRRRSGKALNQILGTGDKTTYLTTLSDGRILGWVWLQKQIKKLNGKKPRYKCPVCGREDYMLLIVNHQPYCLECGGKIVYARENQYYSANEFTYSKCGLVLDL